MSHFLFLLWLALPLAWPTTCSHHGSCPQLTQARAVQSGGAAAIEAGESMSMTLQPGPEGILMRCIPRVATAAA